MMTAIIFGLVALVALVFLIWLNTPSGKKWNKML